MFRSHISRSWDSERSLSALITPESVWNDRRRLLAGMGIAGLLGTLSMQARSANLRSLPSVRSQLDGPFAMQKLTDEADATSYNNFYEFGTGKGDPAKRAGLMRVSPWSVRVEGLVNKPKTFSIEELLRLAPMEERIYRFRCVEAWSMVVPWIGYSLSHVLRAVEPLGSAKYVSFVTHMDPEVMPGLRMSSLDWPYAEGLRMDEAMHPLTMLVFGMYGKVLPNQNGAPLRLAVPWKYGFKSAKSLVTIRLTESQPKTAWNEAAPNEYGFYSNVNPGVPHPRWSQTSERPLGGGLFAPRVRTLMFNGYGAQVASLYTGMDLTRYY